MGDIFGIDLLEGLGYIYMLDGEELVFENDMFDFNGFILIVEGEGYFFLNWEEFFGGMSCMKVEKDEFGMWEVIEVMMLDFLLVWGMVVNCFGLMLFWGILFILEEWVVDLVVDMIILLSWNNLEVVFIDVCLSCMW